MGNLASFWDRVGIVRHLTKGEQEKAIYRGIGSIDFVAACRSALLVGCDPDEKWKRAMVHIKSDLAEMGEALGYVVENGNFQWTGPTDLTASRILAPEQTSKGRACLSEAEEFIRTELGDGLRPAKEVQEDAKEAGISGSTLKRAKKVLGVVSRKLDKDAGELAGKWVWGFPQDFERQGDQGAQGDHKNQVEGVVPLVDPNDQDKEES
jgi:hypothetical protein